MLSQTRASSSKCALASACMVSALALSYEHCSNEEERLQCGAFNHDQHYQREVQLLGCAAVLFGDKNRGDAVASHVSNEVNRTNALQAIFSKRSDCNDVMSGNH